jgi:hypothetical protein
MVAGRVGTTEDHGSQPRRAAHVLAIAGVFVLRGAVDDSFGAASAPRAVTTFRRRELKELGVGP